VFTRVPPKIDPATAVEAVRQKLVGVRPTLLHTPVLGTLAQQLADRLAAGESRDSAYQAIKRPLGGLGRTYQRIGSVITSTADLDAVDGPGLIGDASADDIGIGIAQGPHPELGDNAIWIVLLLATRP
jgi:hypothetical protein